MDILLQYIGLVIGWYLAVKHLFYIVTLASLEANASVLVVAFIDDVLLLLL